MRVGFVVRLTFGLVFTPLLIPSFTTASTIIQPIYYSTSGYVGDSPSVVDNPVSYSGTGATANPVLFPGSFSLGSFVVPQLASNVSVTETNTPFHIDVYFSENPPQGVWPWNTSSLGINGVLDGTLTGSTGSTLIATMTSVTGEGPGPLPFPISAFQTNVPQAVAPFNLASWTYYNGSQYVGVTAPLIAGVSELYPVPEPTAVPLLSLVLAAVWWRRTS